MKKIIFLCILFSLSIGSAQVQGNVSKQAFHKAMIGPVAPTCLLDTGEAPGGSGDDDIPIIQDLNGGKTGNRSASAPMLMIAPAQNAEQKSVYTAAYFTFVVQPALAPGTYLMWQQAPDQSWQRVSNLVIE